MPGKKKLIGLIVVAIVTSLGFAKSGAAATVDHSIRVGAAKVDVTDFSAFPTVAGKYDNERANVRAIVIDNGATRAALISVPGSDFDWPEISSEVTAALHCPAENIVVSATHAHSYQVSRTHDASALSPLTKAVAEAVAQANSKLQPARMGFGVGKSYLNVSRDAIDPISRKWAQYSNLDAPSDKAVSVIKFESPSGDLIAAYVAYAMHPINAYALNVTSGDFPESMSRYVEKAFGDRAIVAFALGAAGDQNPLYLRLSTNVMATRDSNTVTGYEMNREASEGPLRVTDANGMQKVTKDADPAALDELFRFIDSEGQMLGEEVIRVMTWTKTTSGATIGGLEQTVECPGRKRLNGDKLNPANREGMAGSYVDTPPVKIPMGILVLGTVAVAPIGEEIYSQIGEEMQRAAPLTNTFAVTLANERANTGYIPDDASFGHETFQVINSALKPGCAETRIVDTIQNLETEYLNQR